MKEGKRAAVTRRSATQLIVAALAAPTLPSASRASQSGSWPASSPHAKGVLSVRDFGALGNGTNDDTAAIAAAIAHATWSGQSLFFPKGTYILDPESLLVSGKRHADRFVMFGEGAMSVLKVKDGTITDAAKFLLRFNTRQDMELIEIRDLVFDHNARGSPDPAIAVGDPWAYQHSHTIQIAPSAGIVKLVRFSNVMIKDPAADGFNCSFRGTASVIKLVVDNCSVTGRTRVRSDVCFVSLPIIAEVNDFIGDVMEIEAVAPSPAKVQLHYSNCRVNRLDFIAHTDDWMTGNVEVYFDSVTAPEKVDISGVVLIATKCVFGISTDPIFNRWHVLQPGSEITDTILLHKYEPLTNAVGSLTLSSSRTYGWRTSLRLARCESRIDDNRSISPLGAAIVGTPGPSPTTLENAFLEVERHKFDARFETSVYADRCGKVRLVDNDYGGTSCAISYRSGEPDSLDLSIRGGNFAHVKGAKIGRSTGALNKS